METSVLEIATKVSTPLALSGLIIGVLYLLYQSVLKGRLLSTVGPGHSYRIINRVVNFAFVLALLALVLGVGTFLATKFLPLPRPSSALEVTDVAVVERPSFPVLDLKFRNLGHDVTYLKKVSIKIINKKVTNWDVDFFAGPSTWQYNVLFAPRSKQQDYEIPISQVVPPNGTDRFHLVVGQESEYGDIRFVDYHLRVRVFYNANEITEAKEVVLRIYSPPYFLRPDEPVGPTLEERLFALESNNPLTVAEIATLVGAVGEESAINKLRSVLMRNPSMYIKYYTQEILPQPSYRERGMKPEEALKWMYISIFWALKQLSGDYQEELVLGLPPQWQPIANEALQRLKEQ